MHCLPITPFWALCNHVSPNDFLYINGFAYSQNVRQGLSSLPDISRSLPDMSGMSSIFRDHCLWVRSSISHEGRIERRCLWTWRYSMYRFMSINNANPFTHFLPNLFIVNCPSLLNVSSTWHWTFLSKWTGPTKWGCRYLILWFTSQPLATGQENAKKWPPSVTLG